MASDVIFGDDGTLRFVGVAVDFRHPFALFAKLPVNVSGSIHLRDPVLIGTKAPPPSVHSGPEMFGGTSLALADSFTLPSELLNTTKLYSDLRKMQAPYDLLQLLVLLRAAVLDLNRRLGGTD